jgi:hypothetical protein
MGLTAIEQGLQRPFGVGVIGIASGIVHLAATILLLVAGFGLLSLPIGILVREVFCFIPLVWITVRTKREMQIPIRASSSTLKSLSRLSVWTFLTFLNDALANGTTLLLVGLILGKEVVPVVSVSRAAWEILMLVLRRLVDSVQPSLAHFRGEAAREQAGRIANQALTIIVAGLAVGVAGIVALNAPFVAMWVNARLYAGGAFNNAYAAAAICDVLTVTICQLSLSLGEMRAASITQTAVLAGRVYLLAVLLPLVGVLALPISMILAMLLSSALIVRLWQAAIGGFSLNKQFAWRASRIMLAAGLLGYFGGVVLRPTTWPELAASGLAMAVVVCSALAALEPSLIVMMKHTLTQLKPVRPTEIHTT